MRHLILSLFTLLSLTSLGQSTGGHNIACDPEWTRESYGLAKISIPKGDWLFAQGTGALVMTTDCSYEPYLLTAYHVLDLNEDGNVSN